MSMDITISDKYTDETHVFGIAHLRVDGMNKQGHTEGALDRSGKRHIHREGFTKAQAIDWMTSAAEDDINMGSFRIVATPKSPWEIAEEGARSAAEVSEPLDEEYQPGYEQD